MARSVFFGVNGIFTWLSSVVVSGVNSSVLGSLLDSWFVLVCVVHSDGCSPF